MTALSAAIQERGLIQSVAAEIFGVTQSRIPDLLRGKVDLFSRGTLINMAATAGMALIVKVTKQKVPASKRQLHHRGLTPKPRPVRCD